MPEALFDQENIDRAAARVTIESVVLNPTSTILVRVSHTGLRTTV